MPDAQVPKSAESGDRFFACGASVSACITRAAFTVTMLVFLMVGGLWLTLSLKEIPTNQIKANSTAVSVIGEVVSSDIDNLLQNTKQLSQSPLVGTALTDSAGRDAYLRPYLSNQKNTTKSLSLALLDYRGRIVLGESSQISYTPQIDALVSQVLSEKTARLAVANVDQGLTLIAGYPVLFPYNQEAIGVLVSLINIHDIVLKRTERLNPNIGVDLVAAKTVTLRDRPMVSTHRFYEQEFAVVLPERIEGDIPKIVLYSTENPWVGPLLERALWSALLLLPLGFVVWRVSNTVARRITSRLDKLAESCAAISEGQSVVIAEDLTNDEIGVLSRTLRQALASYEQINTNLEELVESKTRQLSASEKRFRSLFESSSSIMFISNANTGAILDANQSAIAYYGYPAEQLLRMSGDDLCVEPREQMARDRAMARTGEKNTFNFQHRLASGEFRDVEVHVSPIEIDFGFALFAIIHDITERKQNEAKLQLAATVFAHSRDGILVTTQNGTIIDVNPAFSEITGFSRDEVVGHNPRLLRSGHHDKEFYAALWRSLLEKGEWSGEIWNCRKNGDVFPEMITISAVRNEEGAIQKFVALFSDITRLKKHEQELELVAHYDALTGVPNRVLLADRLHQAMMQTIRRGQKLAIAYLDLDGFKAVNDSFGHDAGDQLLVAITLRIKSALREGDTLARLGGDEFVVVLLDLEESVTDVQIFTRLLDAVSQPVELIGKTVCVSASIGITFYPQQEDVAADLLLRQADQAMYRAKVSGKNRYALYEKETDRQTKGIG